MKTVIFGKGKVGMATDLTLKTNADFHDPAKGHHITNFSGYDQAIICVSSLNDGPYDHNAIVSCLNTLNNVGFLGLIVIRCTISPVFIRAWKLQYPKLKMIHFPEFMKQGDDDYLDTPWVVVLGGDREHTEPYGEYLMERGYGTRDMLLFCTVEESALIKLHQNAGLALKVVFANLMYEACQTYGVDYETVRRGVTADIRVGPHHTTVPGEHGFGYGGHCLPKDVKCLNKVHYNHNFWSSVIAANDAIRTKNIDNTTPTKRYFLNE